MDCIFCKIAAGSIPADIIYKDDDLVAFRDIHPQAPVHDVIITRRHIPSVNDLTKADTNLAGKMLLVAKQIAEKEGIAAKGYRLAINCGPDGTQEIDHIHLHVIGGRRLSGQLG
ncbi:MAG: histidine triad nucleotide-binding protein [Dehalococcoidia bacterium]|jgi:histidine triad (HIT) family protein